MTQGWATRTKGHAAVRRDSDTRELQTIAEHAATARIGVSTSAWAVQSRIFASGRAGCASGLGSRAKLPSRIARVIL